MNGTSLIVMALVLGIGMLLVRRTFKSGAPPRVTDASYTPRPNSGAPVSTSISTTDSDGTSPSVGFSFGTPLIKMVGRERMHDAYWIVMNELRGEGLRREMLEQLESAVLHPDGCSDPVAELYKAFGDVQWYWPRWNEQCDDLYGGGEPVPEYTPPPTDLEILMSFKKDELLQMAATAGAVARKSSTKPVIASALLAIEPAALEALVAPYRRPVHLAALRKKRQWMAKSLFSRIDAIALEREKREEHFSPEWLRWHPYVGFVCGSDNAPRKCKKLNGKMLLATEAKVQFPELPCDRIDCWCRTVWYSRMAAVRNGGK